MAICTIRLAQSNFHSIQAVQITSMCNSKDNLCNVSFCFSHFIKITSTPLFIGSPTCFCGRRSLHTSFCAPYIGGRSKETHMPRIKQKNTANPNRVNPYAHTVFFPFQAAKAPKLQQTNATTANNIKYSQLIPFPPLSSFVHSQTDKRPRASS